MQQSKRGNASVGVTTLWQGDRYALKAAMNAKPPLISFVGCRRKFATLSNKLARDGVVQNRIDAVAELAGLDIGAVRPEDIALSKLAQHYSNAAPSDCGRNNIMRRLFRKLKVRFELTPEQADPLRRTNILCCQERIADGTGR